MKKILMASFSYILVVGVIGVLIYRSSGINISYITYNATYSPTGMYIFNVNGYLKGLQNSFTSILGANFLEFPEEPTYNWSTTIDGLKAVANALILEINCVICAINIILCPIKFLIYIIFIAMALLGFRTGETAVIEAMQKIYSLNLGYIEYL